ncbi:MAG: hypothetical protein AB1921_15675 [Thermodesulfobacteriota bacterium]
MKTSRTTLCACLLVSIVFLCFLAVSPALARRGPSGSKSTQVSPRGSSAEGTRTTQGANAESEFKLNGKRTSLSGSSSSTVKPGSAQGEATVSTGGGKSATMAGEASVSGNTASGTGNIQTGGGKGAEFSGSAEKGDSGVAASGTMTTNSGKTVEAGVDGTKDSGTITVETEQGEKSVEYGKYRQ